MSNLANNLQTAKLGKYIKFTVVAGLILGTIVIGIFSAKMDSFHELITNELSQITGLPIEIESLKLSLSNGLSLHGSGLKVRSNDNLQQIFSAQNIFLNAKLKPLLKGQLKIKKILLVNPIIDVALGAKLNPIGLPETFKNLETLDQGRPTKSEDEKSSKQIEIPITEPSLMESLRNLFQNQNSSLRIIEIKGAELTLIRPKLDLLPAKKTLMFLSARFKFTHSTPNQININGDLSHLEIEGLSFRGTLKTILAKKTPINIDLESTSASVKNINTIAEALSKTDSIPLQFKSGQIEKIFIHLNGLVDLSDNPLKEVVIESGFKIGKLEISIPKVKKLENILLSDVDGRGVWKDGILNYKINGMLWDGTIESNLIINLPDLLRGSFAGTYNSTTKFNELDLSSAGFNPPIVGTANGSINTKSFLNKDMHTYGNLEINNFSLEHEIPYTVKQATFNFSQKSPHQTLARVELNDLQLNNVLINTASSKLKISPGKVLLSNGRIVPSNGTILFSGNYRTKPNTYVIRINGNKLLLSDFFKEQVEGSGFFNGMFQGNLNTAEIIKQKREVVRFSHIADGLSGKFRVEFKNGDINSSLWMIDELIPSFSPTATAISKKIGLSYDTLIGDFKIWKGKTTIDNFELKGPQINLSASATANLVTGKLDGKIKATPTQLLNSVTKSTPLLGDIFKKELKDILTETHFNLDGTLEKPELILK